MIPDFTKALTSYKTKNFRSAKVKNKGCSGYNSQRECDRRKRQIARGQLKRENGLVSNFKTTLHAI